MSDFKDYIYAECVRQMRSWPLEVRNDIYVIVIYIALVDDDPRLPLLNINYNTLSKWRREFA